MISFSTILEIPSLQLLFIFVVVKLVMAVVLAIFVSYRYASLRGAIVGFLFLWAFIVVAGYYLFGERLVLDIWFYFWVGLTDFSHLIYFALSALLIALRNKKSAKIEPIDHNK